MTAAILLAEDTLANVTLFTAILSKSGYKVDVAATGEEAVSLGSKQTYDLILMDLGLPILDGCEATRILRARGVTTPVFALTSDDDTQSRTAAKSAGMDGFLVKPISPSELLRAVANIAEAR